jgi:hypothetical protein
MPLSRRDYDRAALFIYSTDVGLARTVAQACRDLARKKAGEPGMRATLLAAALNDLLRAQPAPAVFIEQEPLPTRGSQKTSG